MKAITEIDGDTATVEPLNVSERGQLAARLLAAAGPGNGRLVRSVSLRGGGRGYQVPLAVADAAGLIPTGTSESGPLDSVAEATDLTTESEPASTAALRKTPAKKAPPRKAAPLKKEGDDVE